ncbi:MAG TPA: YifB family Mg chelatase-like AAA ATPase [Candidatus Polarisedimenticolaceae bacterium]|nr:YifB family Mg chelatase-like AAA ATPase [Candidatus Polarisedimenticolaceae bacterium]
MVGRARGAVLLGIDARCVEVEVDLPGGLPTIAAVGLPGSTVREGIDRIRAALRHCGFRLPDGRIVVNLAPADLRKQGAALDLPIATALLIASGQIPPLDDDWLFAGELALDGTVRAVRGALSLALLAARSGRSRVVLPRDNAAEAALVGGVEVHAVGHLNEMRAVVSGQATSIRRADVERALDEPDRAGPDLADIRGQAGARRALEIAAAGAHHLLLSGPPGAGKSMLARRLAGILPPMTIDEALTVTTIHSAAGIVRELVTRRPFRAPHHGISLAGLTGGGPSIRPGEIALACHGVLYLDELTEFKRDVLESLRQPLEDARITIVRVHGAATFPAEFSLVASMNPCNCGFHGSPDGRCSCSPAEIRRYLARLSGPLLDRFDLMVDVPPIELSALGRAATGECSAVVRERFGADGSNCNARMGPAELDRHAVLDRDARRLLLVAGERMGLSARGFDRVRRVARTLADLEGRETLAVSDVAEALQYRQSATLGRE